MQQDNRIEEEVDVNTSVDYLDTIEHLKKTTVSKEKFAELKAERDRILKAYANGDVIDIPGANKEEPVNVDELRKKIFSGELNNIDFVDSCLKLRKALIERGERDPFLPNGHDYVIKPEDVEAANNIADVYEQCINDSNGDSNVFTAKLQTRIVGK